MWPHDAEPMNGKTIDDVIEELTVIVDRARADRSRVGYFAALYRNVTTRVRDGIRNGRFEDGARMGRLDVLFAGRYLDAVNTYKAGREPTRSWSIAFRRTQSWPLLIVQHLLLGINAHINLDLAIAAADTAPGSELPSLKRDFMAINDILGEMLDDVQTRIARVSPWMGILDSIGARTDEEICSFCLGRSRDVAWNAAIALNEAPRSARPVQIDLHDRAVSQLAVPIYNPGFYLRTALLGARMREANDPGLVIEALSA